MTSMTMIAKPDTTSAGSKRNKEPQQILFDLNMLLKQLAELSLFPHNSTEMFNQMLAIGLQACGCDYAAVTRTDDRNEIAEMLSFVDRQGAKEVGSYDVLGTPCQTVLASSDVVIFQNVQRRFADEKMLVSMNIQQYVGMKFYVAGRAAGHVFLMSTTKSDAVALQFTQVVLQLLAMYAGAHSDVIQNKQQLETLSEEAYSDAMTSLRNRRAFDHDMGRVMHQLHADMLSDALLILIDIDGLKAINDSQGHAIGDELIKFVAMALKGEARQQDLVYRLGGDEFAILVTGNAKAARMGLGKRLKIWRHRIAQSKFATSGMSLGSALLSEVSDNQSTTLTDSWFQLADSRLYQDKACKLQRLIRTPV
jgi:diguanylate cyclase (GGDEF)-like protein